MACPQSLHDPFGITSKSETQTKQGKILFGFWCAGLLGSGLWVEDPAWAQAACTLNPCTGTSVLQATTRDVFTDASPDWTFEDDSKLNASAANAINGGKQSFLTRSTLNASAANAISGGTQFFRNQSTLNLAAANAISGGEQWFYENATLNASTANAISGGAQYFHDSNVLNASAAGAIAGGLQWFYNSSRLDASAAGAISGGLQFINDNSTLNASAQNAISGGEQYVTGNGTINASATNAISGGKRTVLDNGTINASAAGAISGGLQYLGGSTTLNVLAEQALTTGATVTFDNSKGGTGGTLRLNGHSTAIGGINSAFAGSGVITNDGASDALLTVDTSRLGLPSTFAGTIQDGTGGGRLGLNLAGGGLLLSGTNTYSGGTTISGGLLQLGNGGASGSIAGNVENNGAFAFSRSDGFTFAGVISGSGVVYQNGPGTTTLTGNNSYSGGTAITGGTLQVSADSNLGAGSGILIFYGGRLATTAGFDSARPVLMVVDGRFDTAPGTTLGLTGEVLGNGNLVKTGGGTLRLDNTGNAYGNTLVEAGTLVGNAASISGNLFNAATTVFDQAGDGRFAGQIAGLNGAAGAMVKRGSGTLTLGGLSVLDWTVENGSLVSAAERLGGNARIETGGALVFDQATDARYGGVLSGNGTVVKTGTGALVYDGNSAAFAGTTRVASGTLIVGSDTSHRNAVLGGSVTVAGTLAGHGTVGSGLGSTVTVASGGTLSAGNSIGTLTVDGNLVFDKGSRFSVEVDPDSQVSDRVDVTGNATIKGGSVLHVGAGGNYRLRSTYTILSAKGAVSGSFDSVSTNFAFLTPVLGYGKGDVTLKLLRNDIDFGAKASSGNQIATAKAVESIGVAAANPLYDAVALLPDDTPAIRAAFDGLSGEVNASTVTALLEDSRFVRDAMNARLRAAQTAGPLPLLGYGEDAKTAATTMVPTERPYDRGAWVSGFGSWGHTDSDGNAAELARNTAGFVTGSDGLVSGDWRLGFLAGYSHSSLKADSRRSSASGDSYHLGIYGGRQWGNLSFRSGFAYTWSDIDTNRQVSFTGFGDALSASTRAGTTQLFGELGYGMKAGDFAFEPFANLAYVRVRHDGFVEKGGAAALSVQGGTSAVTFATLGLRAATDFEIGTAKATMRGTLGWRHGFGDMTPMVSQAFTGSNAFSIAGAPIARDAAVIEAGFDVAVGQRATLGLSYQGQLGTKTRDHGVRADLNVRF